MLKQGSYIMRGDAPKSMAELEAEYTEVIKTPISDEQRKEMKEFVANMKAVAAAQAELEKAKKKVQPFIKKVADDTAIWNFHLLKHEPGNRPWANVGDKIYKRINQHFERASVAKMKRIATAVEDILSED